MRVALGSCLALGALALLVGCSDEREVRAAQADLPAVGARGPAGVRRREGLDIWYDGRREGR